MERLLIWRRGRFLGIALTYLLDCRFIVAINLRSLFAFRRSLGRGCGCFSTDAKLMGENYAYGA